MKLWNLIAVACAGAALLHGGAASAANYSESISANPADFTCNTAGDIETCGTYTLFTSPQSGAATGQYNGGSRFFFSNTGDNVTVDVNYSASVKVPNSKTIGLVYVELIAFDQLTQVGYLPQKISNVSSVLTNYQGPANPYFAYQAVDYSASAGHYFTAGTPGAFSIDGINSTFGIVQGNPDVIVAAAYGFQVGVPEPATWAMMLVGFGGLGAVLRSVRKPIAV